MSVLVDGLKSNGFELEWVEADPNTILRAKKRDLLTGKDISNSFEFVKTTASSPSDQCGPDQVVFTRFADAEGSLVTEFLLQNLILTTVQRFAVTQGGPVPIFNSLPAKSSEEGQPAKTIQVPLGGAVKDTDQPATPSKPDGSIELPFNGIAAEPASNGQCDGEFWSTFNGSRGGPKLVWHQGDADGPSLHFRYSYDGRLLRLFADTEGASSKEKRLTLIRDPKGGWLLNGKHMVECAG